MITEVSVNISCQVSFDSADVQCHGVSLNRKPHLKFRADAQILSNLFDELVLPHGSHDAACFLAILKEDQGPPAGGHPGLVLDGDGVIELRKNVVPTLPSSGRENPHLCQRS